MVGQGIEEIWSLFLWAEEGSQTFFCECNAYYSFITELFQGSREKTWYQKYTLLFYKNKTTKKFNINLSTFSSVLTHR